MSNKIKDKPIYKKGWFIVLIIVLMIGIIGAIPGGENEQDETQIVNSEGVNGDNQEESQKERKSISPSNVDWNTESLFTNENGNIEKAANVLNKMSQEDFEEESVVEVTISEVMKAPWKYYGNFVQLSGTVAVVQMYAPNSQEAKIIADNGDCGEVVIYDDDGICTNYFFIGDVSEIYEGDVITIVGLPVGQVEVETAMGGTVNNLVVVGK